MELLRVHLLLVICAVTPCVYAECPSVAVVVVASVFTTLAVVLIVLGIIGFLLWRRRKGLSKPEKQKLPSAGSTGGDKQGYANPAFDTDPELGEAGVSGYVPCKDGMADKKKGPGQAVYPRDLEKKTWSSLPSSDGLYGRGRKASTGSLDRNNYTGDDGLVEVWLTSQDFIGLGFNIAGSMRDGIFVSQVHNRGPAKESGKFKAGDRILSVAISFENMVYEDALTILSYASPYPVKVTLQKEAQVPRNRKLSDVRVNLNHPLYRSQSVNDLQEIGESQKESVSYNPKRSASEMRHDKRDSPKPNRNGNGLGLQHNVIDENGFNGNIFVNKREHESRIDAVIHKDAREKVCLDRGPSIVAETDLPNASIELPDSRPTSLNIESPKVTGVDIGASSETDFTNVFDTLSDQDKLDVLKLSYDDPDSVIPNTFDVSSTQVVEAELTSQQINQDLRSAPLKPERKKKRSSTNSSASHSDGEQISEPSSPLSPSLVDEVIELSIAPPTEAPPPVPFNEYREADEDLIEPQRKERSVTVNSDRIQLELVEATLDTSDLSIDKTVTGDISLDSSVADMDTTLIASLDDVVPRSESPEPVEEDIIAASQAKKDNAEIIKSGLYLLNNIDSTNETVKSGNTNTGSLTEEDLEKDLPNLDMNLNFDTDSIVFKESFPSRNTKETERGVSYDISVMELEDMERKAREEELNRAKSPTGKGGIAFEIRDDIVTGTSRTVNTNSVHRTVSYDHKARTNKIKNDISTHRPTSLKGETRREQVDETDSGDLDWSGSRLVRSGSFTDIPQDDSMKDWTTENSLSDDDVIEEHIQEDSKSPALKTLTRATLFQSKEAELKADLSDSDSQLRSNSPSTSGSSSPQREDNSDMCNTNDDGIGMSPEGSPSKIIQISQIKSELISNVAKYNDNEGSFTVTLNTATAEDEDC